MIGLMTDKKPKASGQGNRALYDAMQEKRRSSATSPHDARPHRERSRQDSKRAAIKRESE